MKTIAIEIPEGKTATQETTNGSIVIKFHDKKKINIRPISYEEALDELTDADDAIRKECEIFPTDTLDVVVYKQLKLITYVINRDENTGRPYEPDWNNSDEKKWSPIFKLSSGAGFANSDYDYTYTHTHSGSRLCNRNKGNSDYIGEQFWPLWKVYLTR